MSSLPFDEKDYRSVIRKWVADRPNRGRGELKIMAEKIGVPSPVFSQMLAGQRELSEDHAYILCDHMEFAELHREYFICLVQIERASHSEYKNHLKKKLSHIQDRSKNITRRLEHEEILSESDQAEFYSSWLYSAIRFFCDMKGGASFDEICYEFRLSRDRAVKIVQFLVRVGLIKIENNRYHMGPSRAHLGRDSAHFAKHHSNWRIRAMERAQNLRDEELMFTGPMTISQNDFVLLRDKMLRLVEEVSATVKDSPSEKLVCFNLDFFEVKA